jgi:hypothetical protein
MLSPRQDEGVGPGTLLVVRTIERFSDWQRALLLWSVDL